MKKLLQERLKQQKKRKSFRPQYDELYYEAIKVWDHSETASYLLEHAVETATDFLTIDELIADYEEHANNDETD